MSYSWFMANHKNLTIVDKLGMLSSKFSHLLILITVCSVTLVLPTQAQELSKFGNGELQYPEEINFPISEGSNTNNLTREVWHLQQIRYNNDQLITVAQPSKYTLKFLPDGKVQIRADCNRATGTYIQKDSSLSILIGPTTRAMCPPESMSNQYLQNLQSVRVFFFQDGNLYLDLQADGGTMMFETSTIDS